MQIHSVGIDLGKTTFHLVALGAAGKVLVKKKFTQRQLLTYTANLQTSLIGLEACSGAHFSVELCGSGSVFAQTPAKLKASMADILENAEADLTPQMRNLIDMQTSVGKFNPLLISCSRRCRLGR
jgi:hypothetical protein